jgi:hypothetical protein
LDLLRASPPTTERTALSLETYRETVIEIYRKREREREIGRDMRI